MALKTDKGVRISYIQGFGSFIDNHTLAINTLSLIHISEPTRLGMLSRMPSSA